MALFKKTTVPSDPPIAEFWHWWKSEGRAAVTAAIDAQDFGSLPGLITQKVHSIHPELVWELGSGRSSQHCLTVSAGGVSVARPSAERWRRSAPDADAVWEYVAARQRSADAGSARLEFEGVPLSLAEAILGVEVDEERASVNVAMFHPAFGQLAPEQRMHVVFLALDWALGEDDVERWLGSIELADARPPSGVGLAELPGIVDALAARTSETWVMMEAPAKRGQRRIVQAQRPLRWIDQPLFDLHSEVVLDYKTSRPDGLPDEDALDRLREQEDSLVEAAGSRAKLLVLDTSGGRRTLHLYSDSEDQNAADIITRWAAATPGARVTHSLDPSWTHLRIYR